MKPVNGQIFFPIVAMPFSVKRERLHLIRRRHIIRKWIFVIRKHLLVPPEKFINFVREHLSQNFDIVLNVDGVAIKCRR